jgi:hypothetical protein
MIDSTSSSDRAARAGVPPTEPPKYAPARRLSDSDTFSADQAGQLQAALAQQPEIRPEVVARGLKLAADPNYPPPEVIDHLAGLIVNSPDLSEDGS